VDIIKSGGFKIGALEIEAILLTNSNIKEVAVIGVPDITWGEIVTAVVSLETKKVDFKMVEKEILEWCAERMPKYRIPRKFKFINSIPRNAMGKVNKKQLLKDLF